MTDTNAFICAATARQNQRFVIATADTQPEMATEWISIENPVEVRP